MLSSYLCQWVCFYVHLIITTSYSLLYLSICCCCEVLRHVNIFTLLWLFLRGHLVYMALSFLSYLVWHGIGDPPCLSYFSFLFYFLVYQCGMISSSQLHETFELMKSCWRDFVCFKPCLDILFEIHLLVFETEFFAFFCFVTKRLAYPIFIV